MKLSYERISSSSSIGKHWRAVLSEVSTNAYSCSTLERVRENMISWVNTYAEHGPRDSIGYPGQNAEFIIEENELRVYNLGVIPGKKKKLMAVVKPQTI